MVLVDKSKLNLILSFFFLCTLLLSYDTFAQKPEPIDTDRPDQTESPTIISKSSFQIESGAIIEMDKPGDGTEVQTITAPTVLFRYGLFKVCELRLGIEHTISKTTTINPAHELTISEFSPIVGAIKLKVCEEKGLLPKTAFLFKLNFPLGKNGELGDPVEGLPPVPEQHIFPEFLFAMQHTIGASYSVSYNLGAEWDGYSPKPAGLYSLSMGYSFNKYVSAFIESYGWLSKGELPDHRFDSGLLYLITNNLQADISGGLGITKKSPDYFVGAGMSLRLPR